MPRYPRQESATGVYHFINRGVNKKRLFHKRKDYRTYLDLLLEYKKRFGISIYHYCLMPNHTHIMLKADQAKDLSRFAHYFQRRYAYYYCNAYHWPEQVFRKRFISIPIETDAQFLECARYVERNPLSANLVKRPQDYPYTSYPRYAYNKANRLIDPSPLLEMLGKTTKERGRLWQFYIAQERAYEVPKTVRAELSKL